MKKESSQRRKETFKFLVEKVKEQTGFKNSDLEKRLKIGDGTIAAAIYRESQGTPVAAKLIANFKKEFEVELTGKKTLNLNVEETIARLIEENIQARAFIDMLVMEIAQMQCPGQTKTVILLRYAALTKTGKEEAAKHLSSIQS